MEKLSGLDAAFLYNETPKAPQHIASIQVLQLEEGSDVQAYYERLKDVVRARTPLVPYLFNRLIATPGLLDHPVWQADPAVDVDAHFEQMTLPAPGGTRQLEAAVAQLHEMPLDRSRPLWRMVLISGLADGRLALYHAVHHACMDGVAGQNALTALSDPTPAIETPPAPTAEAAWNAPNPGEVLAMAWQNIARANTLWQERLAKMGAVQQRLAARTAGDGEGMGAAGATAPVTVFNRSIEAERRFAVAELPLADVKALGKGAGGTVNDAFLALCGGALRRYLAERSMLPAAPLIAGCPVSLRAADDKSTNNQVSMMQVLLATDEPSLTARTKKITASSRIAKSLLADLADVMDGDTAAPWLPVWQSQSAMANEFMRAADNAPPAFNLVVSNVPGSRSERYLAGVKVLTQYPVSIATHGMGVNVTVQSYAGTLFVGITACAAALPDARALRDCLLDEFDTIRERFTHLRRLAEPLARVDVVPDAVAAAA